MKSTLQWIVKSSLALAVVLGMSLATTPAQADSQYLASVMGSLTWDATPGIQFGGFAQPPNLNFENENAMDAATANADIDSSAGQGFLTVTAIANGAAFSPLGWANSEAQSTNLVRVENVEPTGGGPINVEFDASAVWSILGTVNDNLTETAFASVSLFALVGPTSEGPFEFPNEIIASMGSAPPNFDNGPNNAAESFTISVGNGQTVWVGLQANAAGEAHSDEANPIPEPTSILLLGSGMIGLGAWQWRRNKKNQNAA